jgi:hypothetical protein
MARKIPPPPPEQPGDHQKHGAGSPARTTSQKNVCEECGYHRSHAPNCSKNPENA